MGETLNTRRTLRSVLLAAPILALAAAAGPVLAAGPYAVRRASTPAEIATAPILDWSASGTWDDDTAGLGDGLNRFYVVEDAAGAPMPLRIEKNETLGCVRLIVVSWPTTLDGRASAIATLDGLAATGGALEDIAAASAPAVGGLLLDALDDVESALATLADPDADADNLALKRDLDLALRDLLAARAAATGEASAIDAVIEVLLAASRAIALYHLTAAEGACGSCTGNGSMICQATAALVEGDAARDAGSPTAAVDAWARTIERSWQASNRCS